MRTIYLDYNATTPLDPQVQAAMLPYLERIWGNPSSAHHVGRQARARLDEARHRAAAVLGCQPAELIFTSGGTESINLAILGAARQLRAKGRHLISSTIEHHAVLNSVEYLAAREGFEVTLLPADPAGLVSVQALEAALRPDTVLVSIMAANNEIGTLQPVAALGALCRQRGVAFHTDAVQWFGKEPFQTIHQFNADLVSLCAHKFHGPKGAGALFARSPLHPLPLLLGGPHENEQRAGTENLAAIIGLVEALERFVREPVFSRSQLEPLSNRLIAAGQNLPGVHPVALSQPRLANTVSFVVDHTDSISLLAGLDLEGICASSGSACSSGSLEPSHVVPALGFDAAVPRALLRFSLGRDTRSEDIAFVEKVLPDLIRRAQRLDKG
jgi:cysteine desulfurase